VPPWKTQTIAKSTNIFAAEINTAERCGRKSFPGQPLAKCRDAVGSSLSDYRLFYSAAEAENRNGPLQRSGPFSVKPRFLFGGAREDRTPDLLNAIQALSHLSYDPTGENRAVAAAMPGV
jgi:hypothetical protein